MRLYERNELQKSLDLPTTSIYNTYDVRRSGVRFGKEREVRGQYAYSKIITSTSL